MNTQNSDLGALWNWDVEAKWPFIENIAEAEIQLPQITITITISYSP